MQGRAALRTPWHSSQVPKVMHTFDVLSCTAILDRANGTLCRFTFESVSRLALSSIENWKDILFLVDNPPYL